MTKDSKALEGLNDCLETITELLTYEANVPFYPWYEKSYIVDKSRLHLTKLGLDAPTQKALDEYVKGLPVSN